MRGKTFVCTVAGLVACLALLVAGCKKDGGGEGEGGGAAPEGPTTEERVEAFRTKALPQITAALPGEGPKVTFGVQLVDKERVVAAVPDGWKAGAIPGSFSPPDDADLGFMTKYSVGTNCDGTCAPKDWKKVSDDDFAQFAGEQFTIVKDEALADPAGRHMVATTTDGRKTYLTVVRYQEGANRYYTCRATLEDEAQGLLPAFEAACRQNEALFFE